MTPKVKAKKKAGGKSAGGGGKHRGGVAAAYRAHLVATSVVATNSKAPVPRKAHVGQALTDLRLCRVAHRLFGSAD